MANGGNTIGVSFAAISWFENLLLNHSMVDDFERDLDVVFTVRRNYGDEIRILLVNEYSCSLSRIWELRKDFDDPDVYNVGGNWNSYTSEAKEWCLENNKGLFNGPEVAGALHWKKYWTYYRKN